MSHVVVTLWDRPGKRLVVNVYGPYTAERAGRERKKILKDWDSSLEKEFGRGTLTVRTRELLNDEVIQAKFEEWEKAQA